MGLGFRAIWTKLEGATVLGVITPTLTDYGGSVFATSQKPEIKDTYSDLPGLVTGI